MTTMMSVTEMTDTNLSQRAAIAFGAFTTPPVPAFLADVDEDERAQLAALGIVLDTPEQNDLAALDMLASELLRRRAGVARALANVEATQKGEREMLEYRQSQVRKPLETRAAQLDNDLAQLAQIAADKGAFDKKAQSRKTSFGSYGRKRVGEKVVVSDRAAATAWAIEHLSEFVRVNADVSLQAATALQEEGVLSFDPAKDCTVLADALVTAYEAGAQVPGVEIKAESVTYYGKPAFLEADEA